VACGEILGVAGVELGRAIELGVLFVDALARTPRMPASQGAPGASASTKCVGCAQFTM